MTRTFLFLFLLLTSSTLYGCATCMAMKPMTDVNVTLYGQQANIQRITFDWRFNAVYTSEIMIQFDDGDGVLSPAELDEILELKLTYIKPRDMLTHINYSPDDNQTDLPVPIRYDHYSLHVDNGHLTFHYEGDVDLTVQNDAVFTIVFQDEGGFFDFRIVSVTSQGLSLITDPNLYLFTASTRFISKDTASAQNPHTVFSSQESPFAGKPPLENSEISKTGLLESAIITIRQLLHDVKTNQSAVSLALLLLFAYLYGVIHALGPGHGKTLVGSYFLGNDRSYAKAAFVSLAIGVVHTFSAFVLTIVVFFALNQLLSRVMDDVIRYTTIISALIIIAIAVWLLVKKIRAYRKKPTARFFASPNELPRTHVDSCACHACELDHRTTDLALIISAGIIPCPGTVTLFIFALSLGLYSVGFLSAVVMSLGMSTIIFASAALSVTLRRQTTQRIESLKPYLEFGSLGIILALGLLLLIL